MALLEDKFGEWKPVSRGAGIAWLCFYALFLLYALANRSGFLFLDFVNLIIHEGGHFFFSWFGNTIMILGGTLGELLVPLLCAIYFFWQREATAFAFCSFWFFENFPYIGTYMAEPENRRNHAHPRLVRHARHHGLAGLPHSLGSRLETMIGAPRQAPEAQHLLRLHSNDIRNVY